MRLGALSTCFVLACGGTPAAQKATPDPIPKTAGPSCKVVVQHLATLGDRDPLADDANAKASATLRRHCESDGWSDDARSCLATAQSQPELDGCKGMLTEAQRQAFPAPAPAKDPWASGSGGS